MKRNLFRNVALAAGLAAISVGTLFADVSREMTVHAIAASEGTPLEDDPDWVATDSAGQMGVKFYFELADPDLVLVKAKLKLVAAADGTPVRGQFMDAVTSLFPEGLIIVGNGSPQTALAALVIRAFRKIAVMRASWRREVVLKKKRFVRLDDGRIVGFTPDLLTSGHSMAVLEKVKVRRQSTGETFSWKPYIIIQLPGPGAPPSGSAATNP